MIHWTLSPLLAASADRFRSLSQGFRGQRSELQMSQLMIGLACLAACGLALWALAKLLERRDRPRTVRSPRALFQALCRAQGLDRQSRRALWKLAREKFADHPARIFLEPEILESAAAAAVNARQAGLYLSLRVRLFGELGSRTPAEA